jgi:hypothetical protein
MQEDLPVSCARRMLCQLLFADTAVTAELVLLLRNYLAMLFCSANFNKTATKPAAAAAAHLAMTSRSAANKKATSKPAAHLAMTSCSVRNIAWPMCSLQHFEGLLLLTWPSHPAASQTLRVPCAACRSH